MSSIVEFVLSLKDKMSSSLDRVTDKSDKARRSLDKLKRGNTVLEKHTEKSVKSVRGLRSELDKLHKMRDLLPHNSEAQLTRVNRKIKEVEGSLRRAKSVGVDRSRTRGSGGSNLLGLMGGVLPTAVLAAGAFRGASYVLSQGAERDYKRRQFQNEFGATRGSNLFRSLGRQKASLGEGVFDSGSALVRSGFDVKETTSLLKQFGDVANGSEDKLASLAETFGKIRIEGHLTRDTMKELRATGFEPLRILFENTEEGATSLFERLDNGTITIREVQAALSDATSEGGKFFGNLDRLDESTLSRWDRLKDSISTIAGNFGENFLKAVNLGAKPGDPSQPSILDELAYDNEKGNFSWRTLAKGALGANPLTAITSMVLPMFGDASKVEEQQVTGKDLFGGKMFPTAEEITNPIDFKNAEEDANTDNNDASERINRINGGGQRVYNITVGKLIETMNNTFQGGVKENATDINRIISEELIKLLSSTAGR